MQPGHLPKGYTKNTKSRPAKVTTQSCEECRVAAFLEAEVVVEADSEVDDRDGPLEWVVEDDARGRVEDEIEVDIGVDVDEMVPNSEVDI